MLAQSRAEQEITKSRGTKPGTSNFVADDTLRQTPRESAFALLEYGSPETPVPQKNSENFLRIKSRRYDELFEAGGALWRGPQALPASAYNQTRTF